MYVFGTLILRLYDCQHGRRGGGFYSKLHHKTTDIFLTSENKISLRTALQRKPKPTNQKPKPNKMHKQTNLEFNFIKFHCQKFLISKLIHRLLRSFFQLSRSLQEYFLICSCSQSSTNRAIYLHSGSPIDNAVINSAIGPPVFAVV